MAKITTTKVRAFIGAIVAIVLVVLLAAFGARALGWDVPILRNITATFGY